MRPCDAAQEPALRTALARATTQVCEPVLRVALEVPTRDGSQLLRLLGRPGTEVTGQTATADLTRLDARLVAARLHDLQHQLPDRTGGEGRARGDVRRLPARSGAAADPTPMTCVRGTLSPPAWLTFESTGGLQRLVMSASLCASLPAS